MSTIDQNSQNSLSAILDKLGSTGPTRKTSCQKYPWSGRFPEIDDHAIAEPRPVCAHGKRRFYCTNGPVFDRHGHNGYGRNAERLSSQLSEFRLATATNLLGSSVLIPAIRHARMKMVRFTALSTCHRLQPRPALRFRT